MDPSWSEYEADVEYGQRHHEHFCSGPGTAATPEIDRQHEEIPDQSDHKYDPEYNSQSMIGLEGCPEVCCPGLVGFVWK